MGTTSSTNCSNNGVMLDFGSIPDDLLRIILTLCNDPATFMRAGWVNKRYNTFVKSAWQDLAKLTGLTRRANDREAVVAATIAHSNLANRRCVARLLYSVGAPSSLAVTFKGDTAAVTYFNERGSGSYRYSVIDSQLLLRLVDAPNQAKAVQLTSEFYPSSHLWGLGGNNYAASATSVGMSYVKAWSQVDVGTLGSNEISHSVRFEVNNNAQNLLGIVNGDLATPCMAMIGCDLGEVSIFHASSAKPLVTCPIEPIENVYQGMRAAFHGQYLAIPTSRYTISIYKFHSITQSSVQLTCSTFQQALAPKSHPQPTHRMAILPDRTIKLFTQYNDGHELIVLVRNGSHTNRAELHFIDLETAEHVRTAQLHPSLQIDENNVCVTADDAFVYVSKDTDIAILSRKTGDSLAVFSKARGSPIRELYSLDIGRVALSTETSVAVIDFSDAFTTTQRRALVVDGETLGYKETFVSEANWTNLAVETLKCTASNILTTTMTRPPHERFILVWSGTAVGDKANRAFIRPTLPVSKQSFHLVPYIMAERRNSHRPGPNIRHGRRRKVESWVRGTVIVMKQDFNKTSGKFELVDLTDAAFDLTFPAT